MTDRRPGAGTWALTVLVPLGLVGLVVGLVVGMRGGTDAPEGVGLAAPPLELASVSTDVAAHYTFAAAHEHEYADIPCYCGCADFLGHRSLYDCFVRADGRGWDAHASGCGVCIGESVLARELLEQGEEPASVRDAVIERFGSTPATTPPRA